MNQAITLDLANGINPLCTENTVLSTQHLKAFEELFRAQRTKLTTFVRKHIRDSSACEDIVSQTFLEAYRGWDTFRGESKSETWLYGIALNVVRNNVSRQPEYRYIFEDVDEMSDVLLDETADDPLTIALRAETMAKFKLAIDSLPESMSYVVRMVMVEGASYDEVAEQLQIPLGTVRSRLARARETLKTLAI